MNTYLRLGGCALLAAALAGTVCHNAARAAALAACNKGEGAAGLAPAERLALRRRALTWLRAELNAWRRLLDGGPAQARPVAAQQMRRWQADAHLHPVPRRGGANTPAELSSEVTPRRIARQAGTRAHSPRLASPRPFIRPDRFSRGPPVTTAAWAVLEE